MLDTTTGIDIGTVSSTGCSDISDNSVRVIREAADGGTVETDSNETEVTICIDGVPDPLTMLHNNVSSNLNYAYIITDDAGMVLAFPPSNVIDLNGAGVGICRIYGVSFSGTLNSTTGIDISAVTATGCSDISDNSVRVIREGLDGGTVETDTHETEVTICVDSVPDPLTILHDNVSSNLNYAYIVTDDTGMVLAFPPSNVIDLNSAGVGICRIYGVAFAGTLDTTTGVDISAVTATGCSDISDNSVRVIREAAHGGTVETDSSETEVAICIDGVPDPLTILHNNVSSNLNYAYVITDDAGMVLAFPPGNVIDLDGAGPGICRIYGVSFSGTLNSTTGIDISAVTATGCSDISDNSVRVIRETVDGGTVETDSNETEVTICIDGVPDPLTILHNNTSSNLNYAYVITDDAGMVLAFPPNNIIDLDGAGPGVCRIYGVSFSGTLNSTTGIDICAVTATGCSDISDNSVRIIREAVHGGTVSSVDGFSTISICVDGAADPIELQHTSTVGSFSYVITDSSDVILMITTSTVVNLDGAGVGVCHIWGVSYTGTLNPTSGVPVDILTSSGCVDLSDNFIEVTREDSGSACDPTITLESLVELDGTNVMLGIQTLYGEDYRVEATSDLVSDMWTSLTNGVPGNGNTVSVELSKESEMFRVFRVLSE